MNAMSSTEPAGMVQVPSLAALAGIRHGFFTRKGGVSQGIYASLNGGIGSRDAAENVAENRARMAAALAVPPHHLLTVYQTHSADVVTAEVPWSPDGRPHADAIVTRTRGLAIGVTTADCGPVLFADPQAGVIGAAALLSGPPRSVLTQPGHTALTLIWVSASALDQAIVIAFSAALEVW